MAGDVGRTTAHSRGGERRARGGVRWVLSADSHSGQEIVAHGTTLVPREKTIVSGHTAVAPRETSSCPECESLEGGTGRAFRRRGCARLRWCAAAPVVRGGSGGA